MIKKEKSEIKYRMKRLARKFCRRNDVYKIFEESVGKVIEKAYLSTYLLCLHENRSRVAELEEENAELEKQHKIEKEKWYAEYTAMYSDFQKHIEELEKENGTLKERCNILDKSLITSTKNNIERQKIIDEHNDKLTKAKELLSRLKSDFKNFAFEVGITPVSETYFEVEKFLKEINK